MVASPTKRPMPWSACTTRSPTERLDTSVSTSAAALAARLAHEAVAENVLLADHGEPRRLEAGLERQHGHGRHVARLAQDLGEALHPLGLANAVLGQQRRQAARARRCSNRRRSRACSRRVSRLAWATTASNTLTPSVWRSAAKVRPCRPPKRHDARAASRMLERIERDDLAA